MTETAASEVQTAQTATPKQGTGLSIERLYTSPGVHPYDEVSWERRDVVQTNWRTGETVFEQRGVEFPDSWSVNASTIVTSKYFRGAVGSAEREGSLRQLIDRVVLTYVRAGREHGYFATSADAEVFEHELTWMLLHQVFSFNSPVWFNVGTSSPQQVSACQPYDSLVSTPGGLVPIGKLVEDNAVGAKVYDAHGLTRVLAVKANGVKDVLRLNTTAGYALDVTADHLVWRADDELGGQFIEAGSLVVGDLLLHVEPEAGGRDRRTVEIARIEPIGAMEVYDMQTESGEYLSGNLRVHNCFILAVDDNMDSILNWYREEGLIFKGGSGSGLNISRIRSSKELLRSSGGTASGPVSFMRGADASAGTIKSGGATRRAAKMVVLDVDHPDIAEFVQTKAREEDKIRVLRDAGFDMDLGGQDIVSVQYQNANNSVRVTDEFMRAVEEGGEFGLRGRLTGEVIETVGAKKLWGDIAQAAWECADPGVQYDDTINDWHTTPETGRISASNPCSEYMHLDNSSCNLASLNLLTFLRDDGTFDAQTFARAVELVITAMDVSICFADFPTHAIGDTTRSYRQLGIGYANLGALLMASGLAYDSDGGRALAASITSLMTGTAYKRSAELAGVVGPYDGYARNAEPHTRVMRKHQAANDAVRTMHQMDRDVHKLATQMWADNLTIGAENGWRNAQASVLAPTGCLTGDTMVTTDRGLTRLGELGDVWGNRWQDLDAQVSTDEGPRQATKFFVNGEEPTRRIVTQGGYRIQGTLTHRIKVVVPASGEWVWKRMADIAADDLVPVQLGTLVGKPRQVPLPVLDQAYYAGDRSIVVPDTVTPELAELVGYFMGDGSLHAKGVRLCVADTDLDVLERIRVLSKGLFGLEPKVSQQPGYQEVVLQSVRLARWWTAAGFAKPSPRDGHQGKGWTPRVPSAVLETNDVAVYTAFLSGVFEADGTVLERVPSISTSSESFAAEIRTLLLALGMATTTRETVSGWGGPMFQVRLRNLDHAMRFDEIVGFIGSRKNGLLPEVETRESGNRDRIHLPRAVWDEIVPCGSAYRGVVVSSLAKSGGVPRQTAQLIQAEARDPRLAKALGYIFERVAANEDGGVQPTYDLSVPENVTYVAGGFVSHNTIGFMMDCDTTGIEPDFSLVKFKKLVGGGSMQIVNQTVPAALAKLGYAAETIEAIVEYIAEHGHVIDAPGLRPEHYEVFDCAMGERSIRPMGHVRMMAATQPFISGAISKCVVGETLLTTADGLVRIGSMHRSEPADSFRDEIVEVASLGGPTKTDAFYYGGSRAVRQAVLRSGHRVTGTPHHRVLTANRDGLEWVHLSDLRPGDLVAQQYGSDMWAKVPPSFADFTPVPRHGNQKAVTIPAEMSDELAFLLGAYASEGHTSAQTWSVMITNSVDSVLERVREAWWTVFGISARIERRLGKCPQVIASSKTVVEFFRYLGTGSRASDKRIPDAVLRSPRSMVLTFLQGLALDAYCTKAEQAKWAICLDSPLLLDDLQAVLTNLGVLHSRITKPNTVYSKSYDEVYASGVWAQQMVRLVPFLEPVKAATAADIAGREFGNHATSDIVPFITGRQLHEAIPRSKTRLVGHGRRSQLAYLLDPRSKHPTWQTLARVAEIPGVQLPQVALDVLRDGLHFSPVATVEDAGEREVYDVSVPTTHAFVGNGMVNHNTVNLPEAATVEDIADVYYQGWKLGLKALAVYRDNCKVGQPLADAKAKKAEPAVEAPVEHARPVRQRLPKSRPSVTTSFTVGGAEGYMTAGSYPDDGLGEVFLKLGKQGSTLAGVMDAFSMAISISLQYGVPLETYVQKFTNMKFEPAGLTDDPDIRMSQSIMDYIFRRLALDHLPFEQRSALGIYSADERRRQLETGSYEAAESAADELPEAESLKAAPAAAAAVAADASVDAPAPVAETARPAPAGAHTTAELLEEITGSAVDAPLCMTCGTKMRPAGSCFVCEGCGATSGCS